MKYEIAGGGSGTGSALNVQKRLKTVCEHVNLMDANILDLGCGNGEYIEKFLEYTQKVRGIEAVEDKVIKFDERNPEKAGLILATSAEEIPFDSHSFDLVFVNEVLEHIPDQDRALKEIFRVLKLGGTFVLFCPNRLYPFETHGMKRKNGNLISPWMPFMSYLPVSLLPLVGLAPLARNYWPWEITNILIDNKFTIKTKSYVTQTFENISGQQPAILKVLSPFLRALFPIFEKLPLLRNFCSVSLLIICTVKK